MKKTPEQWLQEPQYKHLTVLDPDGWDRLNFEQSWAEPLTQDEFTARLLISTVITGPEFMAGKVRL